MHCFKWERERDTHTHTDRDTLKQATDCERVCSVCVCVRARARACVCGVCVLCVCVCIRAVDPYVVPETSTLWAIVDTVLSEGHHGASLSRSALARSPRARHHHTYIGLCVVASPQSQVLATCRMFDFISVSVRNICKDFSSDAMGSAGKGGGSGTENGGLLVFWISKLTNKRLKRMRECLIKIIVLLHRARACLCGCMCARARARVCVWERERED